MSSRRARSSTRTPTRVIIGGGIALALFYAILGYRAHLSNQRILAQVEDLGAEVQAARSEVEGCNGDVTMAQSAFRRTQEEVDSLRALVDAAEEVQPDGTRGVEAQAYGAYLGDVERYNEAVARWDAEGESLRVRDGECRNLAEGYNTLLDSLRALMAEHGLEG